MKERQKLRDFYYGKKISRQRRTLEAKTRTVKNRMASRATICSSRLEKISPSYGNRESKIRSWQHNQRIWSYSRQMATKKTQTPCNHHNHRWVHDLATLYLLLPSSCSSSIGYITMLKTRLPSFQVRRSYQQQRRDVSCSNWDFGHDKYNIQKDLPPFCPKLSLQL